MYLVNLIIFFSCYGDHWDLHSFPTRRSSDLVVVGGRITAVGKGLPAPVGALVVDGKGRHRSEEHTSELQSRGHLVCRLLLEKKNSKNAGHANRHSHDYASPESLRQPHKDISA